MAELVENAPTWQKAHDTLVGLARNRAGLDVEEGRWLLVAAHARVDRRLGYGSFVEYVERLFGYAPRLVHEKLRVAEALTELPELAAALASGETNWSSVRELTRVATAGTETAWLEAARGRTVREVERMVSGRARGSLPTDPADRSLQRHVLRFEVSGEVLATFREAMTLLRRDAGGSLDDDAALLLMARHVLGGPLDEGRSSYQVELSVCEECRRTWQQSAGESIEVAAPIADMARCDAQHLGDAQVGAGAGRSKAKQAIPPALRREVLRRDRHCCVVPGCRHSAFVDLHHLLTREDGGGHEADNLVTVCGAHHRALHHGELRAEGSVSTGVRFSHADGTEYGPVLLVNARAVTAQTKAFHALRRLGFGEKDARRALEAARSAGSHDAGLEATLRRALQFLSMEVARAS